MVYKKYIKRGNKKFGPYYFKSVRDKDGKVRSVYLGSKHNAENKRRETASGFNFNVFLVFVLIILLVGSVFLLRDNYFGFSVLDFGVHKHSPGDDLSGEVRLVLEAGEFIPVGSLIEVSLEDQSSSLPLGDLIQQSDSSLEVTEGNYSLNNVPLNGSGSGYAINSDREMVVNLSEFALTVPVEEGTYTLSIILKYLDTVLVRSGEEVVVENVTKEEIVIQPGEIVDGITNSDPVFEDIEKQVWFKNKKHTLDLNEYVRDADNDSLNFTFVSVENMDMVLIDGVLSFDPDKDFIGQRVLTVGVTDGKGSDSLDIELEVVGIKKSNVALKNLTKEEKIFTLNENIKSKRVRVNELEVKNGKHDIEIEFDESNGTRKGRVNIRGLENIEDVEEIMAVRSAGYSTDLLFINSINISGATVKLPKYGRVDGLVKCQNISPTNFECDGWEATNVSFQQDDNYVWFDVDGFSGWVGTSIWVYSEFETDDDHSPLGGDYCNDGQGTWFENICESGAGNFTLNSTDSLCYMGFKGEIEVLNKTCGVVEALNSGTVGLESVEVQAVAGATLQTNVSARVYFKVDCDNPVSVPSGLLDSWRMIHLVSGQSQTAVFLGFNNDEEIVCGGNHPGNFICGGLDNSKSIVCGEWHYAEIYYNKDTDNLTCWLNGTVFCSEQEARDFTHGIGWVGMGRSINSTYNSAGTVYLDEARVVAGDSKIGGYPNISENEMKWSRVPNGTNQIINLTVEDYDNDLDTVFIKLNGTDQKSFSILPHNVTTTTTDGGNNYYMSIDSGNYSHGYLMGYTWYANDTRGQVIKWSHETFTVNWPANQSTPRLLADSSENYTSHNLTATNFSTYDEDGDTITNIYHFYKDGVSYSNLLMSFDTQTNDTIKDYSGYGNNGRLTGKTFWVNEGKVGGAYNFTKKLDNDIRLVGTAQTLKPNVSMTLEAFFLHENTVGGCGGTLVGKINQLTGGDSSYEISVDENCKAYFKLWNTSGNLTELTGHVGATGTIDDGMWHHVAGVYNGTDMLLYVDGVEKNTTLFYPSIHENDESFYIGDDPLIFGGGAFNGTIDEVRLYNISLSPEQIVFHNNTQFNVISSNDTVKGDEWIIEIYPNDGLQDGDATNSTSLTILDTPPPQVTLVSPGDTSSSDDRTPTYTWNQVKDDDGDALAYRIQVDDDSGFGTPAIDALVGDTNTYTAVNDLELVGGDNTLYYWHVRAEYVVGGAGEYSTSWSHTVDSIVSLNLSNDTVQFGELNLSSGQDFDNTTDDDPGPVVLQNDGNTFININLTLIDNLWETDPSPTWRFMYKVANYSGEDNSFNWSGTVTSWTNIPSSPAGMIISYLNYTNVTDSARVDINVTVPPNEPAGDKGAQLNFIAWFGE